jgi:hypothetical protein
MALEYIAESHTYLLAGKRMPSVTEVLSIVEAYANVPAHIMEAAADFGRNVHLACDLYDRDELDMTTLDVELKAHVAAYADFLKSSGAIVIASELRVYHAELGYAGTPDKVMVLNGRVALPDIKCTAVVPHTVGAQTAAYAKAYRQMHGGPDPARFCLHLRNDGTWRLHHRKDLGDWSDFVSCLNVYKLRERCRGN